MGNLEKLAKLIKQKNLSDGEIARIIGRPAERGHSGEYIAAHIFDIELEPLASSKGIDGHFNSGNLKGRSVNIKWYGKLEGLLDITPEYLPDFYLVMTGPRTAAGSSRGMTSTWLISYVFIFEAAGLFRELEHQGRKIGIATSVKRHIWETAEIYPEQKNNLLTLSDRQRELLALFG
jgi:hypothetical protein